MDSDISLGGFAESLPLGYKSSRARISALQEYTQKELPRGFTRPANYNDSQWKTAMEIYHTAKQVGVKFPEIVVAQAALESANFTRPSGKNNYLGQKAGINQPHVELETVEIVGGIPQGKKSLFRDYDTLKDSIKDYYQKWGSKFDNAETLEGALYSIWDYDPLINSGRGYATSQNYDNAVGGVLNMYGVSFSAKEKNIPQETEVVSDFPVSMDFSGGEENTEQQNNLLNDYYDLQGKFDALNKQMQEQTAQSKAEQELLAKQQQYQQQLKFLSEFDLLQDTYVRGQERQN